jgi:HEAT repeat protein
MDEVERLTQDLKNDKASVRKRAAKALGDLRDERAVAPLTAAIMDWNFGVRKCVLEAVMKILSKRLAEKLVEEDETITVDDLCMALEIGDTQLRKLAAEALGKLGRREALPALKARLPKLGLRDERDKDVLAAIEKIEKATAATKDLPRPATTLTPDAATLPRPADAPTHEVDKLPRPSGDDQ